MIKFEQKVNIKDCFNSHLGKYECMFKTKYWFCCDKCLMEELEFLNDLGIKTTGACCGCHIDSKMGAFIQVEDEYVHKIIDLGYKQLPLDEYDNGHNAFIPKTKLIIDNSKGRCE